MTNESFARNISLFILFCPAKQRLSGETFAPNNYVRRKAISPDDFATSTISCETAISQDKFLAICFHGTAWRDSHFFAVRGKSESISY